MPSSQHYGSAQKEIYLLSYVERNIFVLDHVHDLALHGENKKNNPVDKQNRPENRHIEHGEEGHQKSYAESLSDRIPVSNIGKILRQQRDSHQSKHRVD